MDTNEQRRRMVERHVEARGVHDSAVLEAMRAVPREAFLPEQLAEFAYEDTPLPIEEGQTIGDDTFSIGFGTHPGTVAAATNWDGPMQIKKVRPSHPSSYERLCHDAGVPAFLLALRYPARDAVRDELASPRLERAIGVIYRPETKLQSHYFQAALPWQFDAYVWFDETRAVDALEAEAAHAEIPHVYR